MECIASLAPYNVAAWQGGDNADFRRPDTLQRLSERCVPWNLLFDGLRPSLRGGGRVQCACWTGSTSRRRPGAPRAGAPNSCSVGTWWRITSRSSSSTQ
jgi:hypothetical protein